MVVSERVIEFPVPDWNSPLISIPNEAFCICYQYDVDINGFGPYGFNTALADALIEKQFKQVYKVSAESIETLSMKGITGNGFYFFELSKVQKNEIKEYEKAVKKFKLYARYGRAGAAFPVRPEILGLVVSGKLDAEGDAEKFLKKMFVKISYSPQAGDSLIFFDREEKIRLKENCAELGISYFVVDGIDNMRAW